LYGQPYQEWNASVVNESEWGFELQPVEIDPAMYDPSLVRFNVQYYDLLTESCEIRDLPSRYLEETPSESLGFSDGNSMQLTWFFNDIVSLVSETDFTRSGNRFLNETLELGENIPWTYMYAGSFLEFCDEIMVSFLDNVEDGFGAADWADGFWEELFTDEIDFADVGIFTYIEVLDEMFGLEEPYVWDGHELIEEELMIDADEPWDNHELLEETLYVDDETAQGIGLVAEDTFGLKEEHHDGWLVEQPVVSVGLAVSVLTQHWRYEKMFGIVIASWQREPIEQVGDDGDHTGDNPWGA